jgi:hypothetical protein
MIVCVEDVFFEFRVAGDMDLTNPMMRNVVEVIVRVEVMVFGRDVDVRRKSGTRYSIEPNIVYRLASRDRSTRLLILSGE